MSGPRVSAVLSHIRKLAAASGDHDLPDDQLLERFTACRDEAAFAALLKRHGPMVLGVCRSILHDVHDADDAFQTAFLLLAQKAGSIQRREAVSGWLYRVAYHLAARAKANAARRRVLEKRAVTMPTADPLLDLSLREVRTILFEELEGLPDHYRAPLILCGLEEKSLEEAARLLGRTTGAIKGRLQRGRALLRARLRRRGLDLPAPLFATAFGLNFASGKVAATLAGSTLRAAVQVAAGGRVVPNFISAEMVALVQGVGMTMFFSKAKIVTVLLLAVSVALTAFGLLRHQVSAADQPAPGQSQVEKPTLQLKQLPPGIQQKANAERTIEVRGRVLDAEGKPVAGANVYLGPSKPQDIMNPIRARSGDDGRFKFTFAKSEVDRTDNKDAVAQVMAVAEGQGCNWAEVGPEGEELTVRLVKDLSITGRILDPDGTPVVGARLTVWGVSAAKSEDLEDYLKVVRKVAGGVGLDRNWHGPLPGQPAVLTTGGDGRFRLAGAGRERVVFFRLEGPAIASAGLHVMTRAGASVKNLSGITAVYGASFVYVGRPTRLIRGVVRDKETGKPLAGASVGAPHASLGNTVTDQEGRYELRGWAKAATYRLLAKPADGLSFQRRVTLQDAPGLDPLTCDIELVRGLTVRGRVTDKATGQPVAAALVDYHPLGGNDFINKLLPGSWNPLAETTTGTDGFYALTVMPGPGVIGVKAPRLDDYMPGAVTFKERKAFFKRPLVEDRDEDYLTRAAGGGSYGAISPSFYNALVLLEPAEKEEALVRNVALERPQERRGRVIGPDGQPLPGVRVCGLVSFGVETLKGNEFTVRGINPRAKRPLVFYHREKNLGFYLKDLRGEISGSITVKLQPCGSASGRVVDEDGQPVARLEVHVIGRALRIMGEAGGGYQTVTTDKDGRFRAEGLVPGQEYVVEEFGPRGPSFPRVYAPVVVEPGQHKDMGDIKMVERGE
jgi:RNA polymerase sigma factor (sigma-70 family)